MVPSFLAELHNLAVNSHAISTGTVSKMKILPILLGMHFQKASKTVLEKTSLAEWEEEGWEDLHDLRKPSEIVIADDTNIQYTSFLVTLSLPCCKRIFWKVCNVVIWLEMGYHD